MRGIDPVVSCLLTCAGADLLIKRGTESKGDQTPFIYHTHGVVAEGQVKSFMPLSLPRLQEKGTLHSEDLLAKEELPHPGMLKRDAWGTNRFSQRWNVPEASRHKV